MFFYVNIGIHRENNMKHLVLNEGFDKYFDESNRIIGAIEDIKKVNILVGENNSGKSRFMRNLLKNGNTSSSFIVDDTFILGKEYINTLNLLVHSIVRNILEKKDKYGMDINSINFDNNIITIFIKLTEFVNQYYSFLDSNIKNNYMKMRDIISSKFPSIINQNSIYIPVLRGIEKFEEYFGTTANIDEIQMTALQRKNIESYVQKAKTVYRNKICSVYNINSNKVFTAENLYDEIVNILLGEEQERIQLHKFEEFISENFYDGKNFTINPNQNSKCLKIKIDNANETEIYNLGDGIKQIITIFYEIFKHKDEEFIFFIDEPEINLHPGFQRKLMELLLSDEFPHHTYFINTHSNHITDIINDSNDVKLLKFKNNNKVIISPIEKNYIDILNGLGVRSSSVFLSNCTIWVEGISDRIYLKKYLEMYLKEHSISNKYKENIHYSFVEYGGKNLPHWNFDTENDSISDINVNSLSHNVLLITDNDNVNKGEIRRRRDELAQIMGEKFYELKSREIENLIKLEVLDKMIEEDNFKRNYNKKVCEEEYEQSKLSNKKTQIGAFIQDRYDNIKKYTSDGKTLINKASFANKICSHINDWDDLSPQAKEIAEVIYNHIRKSN